jgi:hypothetical protein
MCLCRLASPAQTSSQPRYPAFDIEKSLGAHVGADPGLGDQVVAGVDADEVGAQRHGLVFIQREPRQAPGHCEPADSADTRKNVPNAMTRNMAAGRFFAFAPCGARIGRMNSHP